MVFSVSFVLKSFSDFSVEVDGPSHSYVGLSHCFFPPPSILYLKDCGNFSGVGLCVEKDALSLLKCGCGSAWNLYPVNS